MKLNAQGIICPGCGEEALFMGGLTWRSTWLGWTRTVTHVCANHEPSIHYLLLYDENMNFVTIIPGADRFLDSCGNRIYFSSETEDIELIDGG